MLFWLICKNAYQANAARTYKRPERSERSESNNRLAREASRAVGGKKNAGPNALAGVALLIGLGLAWARPAHAQTDLLSRFLPELEETTQQLTRSLVATVGFGFDHRPLRPATALGKRTELGIEASGAKFPSALGPALESVGFDNYQYLEEGVVPAPKLFLKRGLGPRLSVGISGLKYSEILIYGFDLQTTLREPEEGLNVALRLGYNRAEVLYMKTHTWSPSLLISRALEFADPYLGIGYQYARGDLEAEFEPLPGVTTKLRDSATASSLNLWLGTQFRPESLGVVLALEGGYSTGDMHWLGFRMGIALP
jgi:hypothetical protein